MYNNKEELPLAATRKKPTQPLRPTTDKIKVIKPFFFFKEKSRGSKGYATGEIQFVVNGFTIISERSLWHMSSSASLYQPSPSLKPRLSF